MAQRYDYYFRQKVTEAELDAGFDGLETADFNLVVDHHDYGVAIGAAVAQQASPNLTVQISGPAVAYDKSGRRMAFATTQNLDVSVDDSSVTTAVAGGGNEKWISVFLEFDRALSDPRIDGNSIGVFFNRAESFQFSVVQGAEAGTGLAVRPTLDSTKILLADVKRTFGDTSITTAQISTTRREDVVRQTGTYYGVVAGSARDAAISVLTGLNSLFAALAAQTGGSDGVMMVGAAAAGTLSAGTLRSQLNQLDTLKVAKAGDTMSGNLVLSGTVEVNYSAARTRVIQIPSAAWLSCVSGAGVPAWYLDSGFTPATWTSLIAQGVVVLDLAKFVHTGYVITQMRFLVHPNGAIATVGNRMQLKVTREIPDWSTPTSPGEETVSGGLSTDNGTGALQIVTVTPSGGLTIDRATRPPFVKLTGSTAAGGCLLHSTELTVTVPGPR